MARILSFSPSIYVCIYIHTHIAARFSRFSLHLPSTLPAGTSDAPKALSPADLYKLMGNTGSLDDAVPVSDSIVANVIREHQAWHEGFHPAVHPSVHLSFHPSIYLSIDPGIVSIYIYICIYRYRYRYLHISICIYLNIPSHFDAAICASTGPVASVISAG